MNVKELKELLRGKDNDLPVVFAIFRLDNDDPLTTFDITEGGVDEVEHVNSEVMFNALVLYKHVCECKNNSWNRDAGCSVCDDCGKRI